MIELGVLAGCSHSTYEACHWRTNPILGNHKARTASCFLLFGVYRGQQKLTFLPVENISSI